MRMPEPTQHSEFEQPKPGVELALAYRIIDLGTQPSEYKGVQQTPRRKLYIGWELPDQLTTEGKPFIVGNFYTYNTGSKSNLRRDLGNWRGKPFSDEEIAAFDLEDIFKEPFMITLVESGNGKVYPGNISAVPARMKEGGYETSNDYEVFSLEADEYTDADFDKLPDGFKRMVANSPEYKQLKGFVQPEPVDDIQDDMPPFAPVDAELAGDDVEDGIPF